MPKGSGRRPIPTAVKELRGNPGKRKLNPREPKPAKGIPEMPAGLSEVAQGEWHAITPILDKMGVLTRADGKALGAYCDAYALALTAKQEIAEHGITVKE